MNPNVIKTIILLLDIIAYRLFFVEDIQKCHKINNAFESMLQCGVNIVVKTHTNRCEIEQLILCHLMLAMVYILDDSRNVRLVLAGTPVDIEKDLKNLTHSLSDLTSFDIRIRMLEPHMSDNYQPATDVYLYAVDPRTNTVVDMDVLQSKMSSISMSNITLSSRILGLAELGEYQSFNAKIPQTNYKGSNLKTSELATIILAIAVFTGGLATAFCVVCVRYKRERHSGHGRHDFIDVPLSQPALSPSFNLMDHENRCIKYNPLQHQNQNINNLDTSVPSIHSSGCDSGVGLTTQLNAASSKQLVQLMRSSQRENLRDRMMSDKRVKRCVCGFATAGAHVCNAGEESSDSYEDSLKNVSCLRISRRTSFPKSNAFRRSLRSHRLSTPRDLHPFSGVI